jgi:hypothetical protein
VQYTVVPSGLTASFCPAAGNWMKVVIVPAGRLITFTKGPPARFMPVRTYRVVPAGLMAMPAGAPGSPVIVAVTACVAVLITDTLPTCEQAT